MNKAVEKKTKVDPPRKLALISKLFANSKDSNNPDKTVEIEVAKPLWMLSAYLTTMAMTCETRKRRKNRNKNKKIVNNFQKRIKKINQNGS